MLLGVEIEFSSIKVAQLTKKNELTEFAYFDLPENTLSSEGILQIDSFVRTLSKIPPYFKQTNPKIAFSLSGPIAVVVRIIQLPYIDKNEISVNLPYEIDKHIPFSVKDVYFDFHILDISKQTNTSEVVVAAANKQIVNEYVTAFERAGMSPTVVDIGVLALYNAFSVNYKEDLVAVMNIGESFINFFIAKGNKPLYFRESINIYKINSDSSEQQIREFADEMAAEIYRQIEYFRSEKTLEEIKRIYVSGFPVGIPQFISSLQERLEQEVRIFDCFRNIKINKKIASKMQQYANIAAIPVGLSLRGTEKIK